MAAGGWALDRNFSWRRALAVARLEARQFVRDRASLGMALGMPLFLVLFFGVAIDYDLRDIPLGLADRSHSAAGRRLAESFSAAGYFKLLPLPAGQPPIQVLDRDQAKGVLTLEPRLARLAGQGLGGGAQLLLDGTDYPTVAIARNYAVELAPLVASRLLRAPPPTPALRTRYLFNARLLTRWHIVPGLVVIVVGLLATVFSAATVARDWELGRMERLLATPTRPLELMLGKLLPYAALGLLNVVLVYALARLAFGLPFRGSHLLFALSAGLFLLSCLAEGLLISVWTREQRLATQWSELVGILPAFLFSDFIFPLASMPAPFRWLAAAVPARWFMGLCRDAFLKESHWSSQWPALAALGLLTATLLGLALWRFKADLEP